MQKNQVENVCVSQAPQEQTAEKTLFVLIVDDDPTCRIFLKKSIEKSRTPSTAVCVECAATKKEMFEYLYKRHMDIILLDLYLPDGEGLEMVEQINQQFSSSAILVITGENDESIGLAAMSHGAQDYLIKGEFNARFLDKAIRFALERKKNQAQTEKALQELAKAHKRLQEAQSQIVQNEKLASIGNLAAGVAHEMNTPVGFVASNFETLQTYMEKIQTLLKEYQQLSEMLEDNEKPDVLEKILRIRNYRTEKKIEFVLGDIKDLFEESREGLERVTTIIQNLRDFSRIDQASEMAEYDLNEGIKNTLVVARNEIKYDADIVLELGLLPRITCNPGQINQVFLNILVNAAQAIRLQNREDMGRILIQTRTEEEYVVCVISDDGPGIPQEILSKIFDPFFTTKAPGKGTGLGLSVSRDIIVNKHKGILLVESGLGEGTSFTIKLKKHFCPEKQDEFSEKEIEKQWDMMDQ